MAEPIPSIERIEGIVLGDPSLSPAIDRAAENAALLYGRDRSGAGSFRETGRSVALAAEASLVSVNALLRAAAARCQKTPPPPVDIDMVTDPVGGLVYRCRHKTPHRWTLAGVPLP